MESKIGSSPTGLQKEPTDFSSGLKLPKLDANPRARSNRGNRKGKIKGGGSEDSNSKVRLFKNSHKDDMLNNLMTGTAAVGGSGDEASFHQTGLFSLNSHPGLSDAESEHQLDVQNKVKGFIVRRKKNRLDLELHNRISKAYEKMEFLEKGVKSFDDTLLLAKGRLIDAGRSGRTTLANSPRGSGISSATDIDSAPASPRLPIIPKAPKDILNFGLGALRIAHTKLDDQSNPEEAVAGDPDEPSLFPMKAASTTTSLSLGQRQMGTRLRLHEKSGSHGLENVRSKIQVMKMKSEREDRKTKTKVNRSRLESTYTGEGNLTRLMIDNPNQGPVKEFMDFLQAHGGSTGGWDKEDHGTFLIAYMKWKHVPSEVIRSVSAECPGRRMQEVAAHLDWYETYERLNVANKAYVRQWKINKRRERQQMYKMARETAKAQIEGEKSRQEMIKAKREVEKERERVTLNEWKKSKKAEVKKLEIETDMLRDPDGAARTTRLGQNLQMTKEKLVKLLPPTHQVRKVLTKSRLALELKQRDEGALERSADPRESDSVLSPLSSDQSFPSEPPTSVEFLETLGIISAKQNGEEEFKRVMMGDLDEKCDSKIQTKTPGFRNNPKFDDDLVPTRSPSFVAKRRSNEKMLAYYRNRDDKIVSSKLNAIRSKKESQKNKAFLSTEETKERISKITSASQVTRLTKGIKLRQNIRELEAIEASVHEELKKTQNPHHISRVPSPQMFKTGPTLHSIPKLGAPAWRKS